jgi:hypothetical protein
MLHIFFFGSRTLNLFKIQTTSYLNNREITIMLTGRLYRDTDTYNSAGKLCFSLRLPAEQWKIPLWTRTGSTMVPPTKRPTNQLSHPTRRSRRHLPRHRDRKGGRACCVQERCKRGDSLPQACPGPAKHACSPSRPGAWA